VENRRLHLVAQSGGPLRVERALLRHVAELDHLGIRQQRDHGFACA